MEAGSLNISEHDPSNPREVFRLLWRRKKILLLCIVLLPVAAYFYSDQLTKTYQSSTVLQIQAVGDATDVVTGSTDGNSGNIAAVARLAETSGVTDAVARRLGLRKGSLRGAIVAKADIDTGFITLTAQAENPRDAARIASTGARALNATRERRGVERTNSAIDGLLADLGKLSEGLEDETEREQLSEKLQSLRTLRAAQGSNAQVIEPAAVPGAPVSPNPQRNAILALVLAILAGVGLVILVDRMDRRLRDADEIEKMLGLPLLAVLSKEAFPGGRPTKRSALAFQTLRDSLTYFNVDETLRIIAVTSPLKGEGKTTVATNLAVSLARANNRVILVDADLRRPQVARRMGVEEGLGLSSVLLGAPLDDALVQVSPFGSQLRILPAGPKPPNPSELIGSKRMSALLDELTARADVVVIDTPPMLVVSDAFPLLEQISGTVGVARLDQTPREAVQRMVEITGAAGGRVFGMVATGAKGARRREYKYGYGYETETPIIGVAPQSAPNGAAPSDANHESAAARRRAADVAAPSESRRARRQRRKAGDDEPEREPEAARGSRTLR
ncbi:MAG: polysaccharide biosynthesis tyrosine autokinase [Egibacteraceae bacterium]